MNVWKYRFVALVCGLATIVAVPTTSEARVSIAEWDDGDSWFELAGYLRNISGVQDLGYGGQVFAEQTALNMAAGRLEWSAGLGPDVELKLHNELLWQVGSGASFGTGSGGQVSLFGIGASQQSDRTVSLESTLAEGRGFRLAHDVDRLAVDIYTEAADLTIGRQGITWGKSTLFPVADLWSRFGPFDLDTERKPGVDAARALIYPSLSTELDLVVADRGSLEDLSAGARFAGTVGDFELYGAGGKFWDELLAMGGATWVLDRIKLRAEGVVPWHLGLDEVQLPRATAGLEWFGTSWTAGAEYHFNGLGAAQPEEYGEQFTSPAYLRGESYYLGRHYAGVYGNYSGIQDVELNLSSIGNLGDPSVMVAPSAQYQLAQNTSIGAGAFLSFGEEPSLGEGVDFESEYGAYGNFYYVELVAYY
jgi:hypothetical protein